MTVRVFMILRSLWAITPALAVVYACGREVVFVDPPPASGGDTGRDSTDTDTTTAARVDLLLTVQVSPAEAALSEQLGFPGGRVPDAQVTARRVERGQPLQAGTTDSSGMVTLPGLLEGTWAITVLRPLTDTERTNLDSANLDVTGFAGAGQFPVSAAETEVNVEAVAGRQGTLVISEAYLPIIAEVFRYEFGQYIEVHNNSFDTVNLDGKIIGRSLTWVQGTTANPECPFWAQWLEDPAGIWTRHIWAFPGSGTDYPLPPGGSAVVALDAIDHRTIHPGLVDLSGANFEFIGAEAGDVDNPQVPNMVEFPPYSDFGDAVVVHGPRWVSDISIFLADPVDPYSLPRDQLPVQTPEHLRIPRDKILDVLTSGSTPARHVGEPYCPNFVHPSFDGQYALLVDHATAHSIARKPLLGAPPALKLLQRTKVSAVDFAYETPPSPGRVP